MKYGPIRQRLAQRGPKAKKVHHTADEAKSSMGIAPSGKLPKDVDEATARVEQFRPHRKDSNMRKLFRAASGTQHALMDQHLKDKAKNTKADLKVAVDDYEEKIKNPKYEAKRKALRDQIRAAKRQLEMLMHDDGRED